MTDRTDPAFKDENDPRFVRFVLPLARLHHSRSLRSGVIKLALGVLSAAYLLYFYGGKSTIELAIVLGLPIFLLIATMQPKRHGHRLRRRDFPKGLIEQERIQIIRAIIADPPKAQHLTPYIEDLRRKTHRVLLIRLILIVALVAVIVVKAALF